MITRTALTCPTCQQPKILAFRDSAGQAVCSACAGQPSRWACEQCGREAHRYGARCARCVLTDRVAELLTGPDGHTDPRLAPVASALLAAADPNASLLRLQRGASDVLSRLAAGTVELSHAGLDQLVQDQKLEYLRDLLVATGVLPHQHVYLARFTLWFDQYLAARPLPDRAVLRAYVTWQVLRRMRAAADRGGLTEGAVRKARHRIRAAARLLEWLTTRRAGIDELSQPLLDLYLVEQPTQRQYMHGFITWVRHRYRVDLELARQRSAAPPDAIDDDARWQLVRELLTADTLAPAVRVAAMFVLLYGQPLSRVASMTRNQIFDKDAAGMTVRFADHDVIVPEPVAVLVRNQLTGKGHTNHPSLSTRWLFPSVRPGRHRTAGDLAQQLDGSGVPAAACRNAARRGLAAHIPAPVLADIIGITPRTAADWTERSGRRWAGYIALRRDITADTHA